MTWNVKSQSALYYLVEGERSRWCLQSPQVIANLLIYSTGQIRDMTHKMLTAMLCTLPLLLWRTNEETEITNLITALQGRKSDRQELDLLIIFAVLRLTLSITSNELVTQNFCLPPPYLYYVHCTAGISHHSAPCEFTGTFR